MGNDKWKIGWGISNKCNMACKFCYSRNARREPNYKENIQNGLELILKNRDRIESINFGTGEPTVEPELFNICEIIRREAPHISLGITTNGTLAKKVEDPHNLEVFKNCIDDVDISLDYADRRKQDESRSFHGAYDMAVQSLKLCKEYGKNASIVNALHRYNCTRENLDGLMRLARLMNASLRINIYRPVTGFDFALSYTELKDAFCYLTHTYEIESIADPLFASLIKAECPAGDPVGRSSFRILPNGYITPSTYLLDKDWQALRLDQVTDIDSLSERPEFTCITSSMLPKACQNCINKSTCSGGVIDRRWLWYHDLNCEDYYCPLRYHDSVNWTELTGEPLFSKERKSFVHDGYLPTLIFGSKINERALKSWDRIYLESKDSYSSEQPDESVSRIGEMLTEEQGTVKRVLDLGSGFGRNGLSLLRKGFDVTFVDYSFKANDVLLEKILDHVSDQDYQIIDSDLNTYLHETSAETFDAVIAMHVLAHGSQEEISNSCHEILRVLKKGGYAVLTLPSINDKRYITELKENSGISESFALTDGPECGIVHSFFSRDSLEQTLSGFEIVLINEEFNAAGCAHFNITVKKS